MSSSQPTTTADQPSDPASSAAKPEPAPRARVRTRWVWVVAASVVVAGLAALFGFALTRDPSTLTSPLVGHRAPDLGYCRALRIRP